MPINPTGSHGLQLPTAADFITNVLFEQFAAYEFTVINLAASGSGLNIGLATNTNLDLIGNITIEPRTSATFTAIRVSNTQVDIYRL